MVVWIAGMRRRFVRMMKPGGGFRDRTRHGSQAHLSHPLPPGGRLRPDGRRFSDGNRVRIGLPGAAGDSAAVFLAGIAGGNEQGLEFPPQAGGEGDRPPGRPVDIDMDEVA